MLKHCCLLPFEKKAYFYSNFSTMPILNYTTAIDYEKSIMEIRQNLVKHGATRIVSDYNGLIPSAISFSLEVNGNPVAFRLPANYRGVLAVLEADKKVPARYKSEEHALKVSWRIIKDWVEVQMALVEVNLAEMAEVFLPYALTGNGNTLYEEIKAGNMNMKMLKDSQ